MLKPFPELASIHTVAMDFDGVFTDNKVWVDQDGRESVRCDRADGLAFDLVRAWQEAGKLTAEFFILSKEANQVVLSRAKKLQLACHYGVGDKLSFMERYLASRPQASRRSFDGLMYLGNDINDLPLLRRAGYAIVPQDAHPAAVAVAHHVLPKAGGEGCVRLLVERLLGIDKLTEDQLDDLISNC